MRRVHYLTTQANEPGTADSFQLSDRLRVQLPLRPYMCVLAGRVTVMIISHLGSDCAGQQRQRQPFDSIMTFRYIMSRANAAFPSSLNISTIYWLFASPVQWLYRIYALYTVNCVFHC